MQTGSIDQTCYSKKWLNISFETVKELEESRKIKVFKIHNKDFRKDKKEEQKVNLFTKYWLDAMLENNQEIRILPEIDIFKRPKEEQKEQKTRKLTTSNKEITEQARIFKDKLYGAFRLEFYPSNNETKVETINDLIKKEYSSQAFYLGIDRGENKLASFCLIDSDGQLVKNDCWNEQGSKNFADELKKFYFSIEKEGKVSLFEEKYQKQLEISAENNQELKSKKIQEFRELEERLIEANQLATDFIKNSYCAYLIGEINQILVEYPHTYIVFEDLDIKGKVNSETGETNKEQNLEKTMGATVYQAIENAIVNKFKYYTVKTGQFDGQQFVPNINKVEDLRIKDEVKNEDNRGKIRYLKSKAQIGNILFVDEEMSSNECPACTFRADEVIFNHKFTQITKESSGFSVSICAIPYFLSKDFYKINANQKTGKIITEEYLELLKNNTPREDIQLFLKDENGEDKEVFLGNLFMCRAKKNPCMKNGDKDYFYCPKCGFSTTNCNSEELKNGDFVVTTGDEVAAYNIAKRGFELISGKKIEKQVLPVNKVQPAQSNAVNKNQNSARIKKDYNKTR